MIRVHKILKLVIIFYILVISSCISNKKLIGIYEFKYHPGIGYLSLLKDHSFEYEIIGDLYGDKFYGTWKKTLNIISLNITSHDYSDLNEKTKFDITYSSVDNITNQKIKVLLKGEPYPVLVANINDTLAITPDSNSIYNVDKGIIIEKVRFTNCIGLKECIEFKIKDKSYNCITVNITSDIYAPMIPYVPKKTRWFYNDQTIRRFDALKEKYKKKSITNI